MGWARYLALLLVPFAAACAPSEDRAFATRFVEAVRNADEAALKPQFEAGLWSTSRPKLALARSLFPSGEADTRLEGYHVHSQVTNGASRIRKKYILATVGQTQWTQSQIVTLAEGGPARVVEWNVRRFNERRPGLDMVEAWKSALPWIGAALAAGLAGGIGLVWWLVRRSRRRDSARL